MTARVESASPVPVSGAGWLSTARARLKAPGARQWFMGAAFGLLYQVIMIVSVWTNGFPLWAEILATVLLVPFYLSFVVLPPLLWSEPLRVRLLVVLACWLYSFIFWPLIGSTFLWNWILVGAIAATLCEEFWIVLGITIVLAGIPIGYSAWLTAFADPVGFASLVIFSVTAMMFGINRQIKGMRELKAAQSEVARLAVVEERNRFSRDMHDVLGHSLTVVTVKSELARRLVSIDPQRAEAELADIERLSRAALSDLRAAVAGYREMNLSTELGAAQAALAAADIRAELPPSGDIAAPDLRELFGWVLREGVTNVIRHSGAKSCWVQLTRTQLTISDDGRGLDGAEAGGVAVLVRAGTGLTGLTERANSVGAELETSRSDRGGLRLTVRRAVA